MTNVLVCVKRVVDATGEVVLTDDAMRVDGRYAGYTTSAHEEAAVALVRQSPAVIVLPRPDGTWERFAFVESSIMEPELQAQVPDIRTDGVLHQSGIGTY